MMIMITTVTSTIVIIVILIIVILIIIVMLVNPHVEPRKALSMAGCTWGGDVFSLQGFRCSPKEPCRNVYIYIYIYMYILHT